MKNSLKINVLSNPKYKTIAEYDRNEIDNPNHFSIDKINYLHRLYKFLKIINHSKHKIIEPKVLDIGCAQGNLSLLLAEKGCIVDAIDLRADYLEYSKLKYEKGDIRWLNVNIMDFVSDKQYDFVILGEILEHCAYPEKIIAQACSFLNPGGYLIATTPNGFFFRENLPSFRKVAADRGALEKRQYGPEGKDHLFLFTLSELKELLAEFGKPIESGYLGSYLVNRVTINVFKYILSPARIQKLISLFESFLLINRYFSQGLYAVIRKQQ